MSAQPAPALLARSQFVTVVDRHTETELGSDLERGGEPERFGRKLDLVVGLLGGGIAGDDGFGPFLKRLKAERA